VFDEARSKTQGSPPLKYSLMVFALTPLPPFPPPTRRYLALPEAVASFATHMTTQLNLLTEAAFLRRLAHNFASSSAVVFPTVFDASPDPALR
jgi:predicted unusual protein kinase regulating ubiquinone biosynthesis (AarF/ABC1/UbiB family)